HSFRMLFSPRFLLVLLLLLIALTAAFPFRETHSGIVQGCGLSVADTDSGEQDPFEDVDGDGKQN
ncbi:hypothetical protein PENTCL1PPCAC_4220, partial [Pristionchus entomophagus]